MDYFISFLLVNQSILTLGGWGGGVGKRHGRQTPQIFFSWRSLGWKKY
jgi:hypothetical protein